MPVKEMNAQKFPVPLAKPRAVTPRVTNSTTQVSATLKDLGGTVWANANVMISFVPAPNIPGPYFWGDIGGDGDWIVIHNITADANGFFTLGLQDNTTVTPAGSMWRFTIAPNATQPAVIFTLMLAGSAMDISSVFTSQSYQLQNTQVMSMFVPRAYGDNEVAVPPNAGQLYYDSTNHQLKMWTSGGWHPIFGGGFTTVADGTNVDTLGTGIYHTDGGFGGTVPVVGPLAGNSVCVVLGTLQFLYAGSDNFNRLWTRQYKFGGAGWTDWGTVNETHFVLGTADPGNFNHTGTWTVKGGFSANGPAVSNSQSASVEVILADFGDPTVIITQRCICPYDATSPTKQWIRFFNLNGDSAWGAWA